MNVAQYIARFLVQKGTDSIFMVTGGGAMFLNDALSFESGLDVVFCHHEQACAMAAEGYARVSGKPGVVNVTAGPGAINALNGVFGAFTDSIPMLVLSGQVKRETHLRTRPVPGLRQLGDQEVDIVAMASPICKWIEGVYDPLQAPAKIAEAWRACLSGRPGPAWLDIPIDVQSSELPEELCGRGLAGEFDLCEDDQCSARLNSNNVRGAAADVALQIAKAHRPIMLWGTGVRLSGERDELLAAAELLDCPIVTAWTHDTLPTSHRLHAGRPGTIGTRAGNFALQKSDLVLALGSRLNIRQTSYNFKSFAKNARIIQVDVDPAELDKPLVKPHQPICADLTLFAPALLAEAAVVSQRGMSECREHWHAWIASRKAHYPDLPPGAANVDGPINPYALVRALFELLPDRAVVVTGNASACIISFQCGLIREGQRHFSNSGSASMGYDIPAAVGAACADRSRLVVVLAGDGSAQMNIQELETIQRLGLNLKVVIIENGGYLSIKSSQGNFFKRLAGCSPDSGVGFPNYADVATAYGIPAITVEGTATDWRGELGRALGVEGPILIQAKVDPNQGFEPRMSSRKLPNGRIVSPELEDMHPFLPADELAWAMGDQI